jgi:hypothetical protein
LSTKERPDGRPASLALSGPESKAPHHRANRSAGVARRPAPDRSEQASRVRRVAFGSCERLLQRDTLQLRNLLLEIHGSASNFPGERFPVDGGWLWLLELAGENPLRKVGEEQFVAGPFVSVEVVPMLVVKQGQVAVIKAYVGLVTEDTSGVEFKYGSLVRPGIAACGRSPCARESTRLIHVAMKPRSCPPRS